MTLRRYASWVLRLCEPPTSGVEMKDKDGGKLAEQLSLEVEVEKRESISEVAERVKKEFDFSEEDVMRAVEGFMKQMNQGLQSHGCTIEQVPSFIAELPTGFEKGTYLAVDLGGTNIRVCSVTFNGDGTHSLIQDKMVIPVALMISETSKGLFSLVARSVQGFLRTCHPESLTIEVDSGTEARRTFDLGFTFSHAVDQLNINSGTLIRWSKGFDISGVVGQDICALLQTELTELALPVRVTALINDTVGTLMARSYASPESAHTVLGAVFGTGTNGAYVEKASKITKLNGSKTEGKGIMIVNSEWGNFDQNLEYLPTTAYDEVIDVKSVNPGFEMFEKRISGMYLGELLRLVLLSLIKDPKVDLLATSTIPETSKLYVQWGLDSSFLSYLESDSTPDLSPSVAELEQWTGITNATIEDVKALRIISHAIGRRSARLSAVALGAVILQTNCLGEDGGRVDIGVDGSLIELYPGFLDEMRETLRSIPRIGDGEKRVDIVVAKDGSGVGAALAAHIAARHLNC